MLKTFSPQSTRNRNYGRARAGVRRAPGLAGPGALRSSAVQARGPYDPGRPVRLTVRAAALVVFIAGLAAPGAQAGEAADMLRNHLETGTLAKAETACGPAKQVRGAAAAVAAAGALTAKESHW